MKENIIKTFDFIQKFDKILENYKEFLKKKEEYGFNIFSVSTYTSYLENFHSDVLYSLLSQNGLHNEGILFIEKFFEYLRNLNIGISDISNIDFNKVKVYKEIGDKQSRIDILITYNEKNDNKTKAIIFENKINNAPDQDKQLERYYNWCESNKYEVVSILYVSLDGYKTAPKTKKEEIKELIKDIAFFKEKNDACLVNGWLQECQPTNEDTKSFLNQYIKLLKFLRANTMNKENMKEFYEEAGNKEIQEELQMINELNHNLPVYRAEKFFEKFSKADIPFKKIEITGGYIELKNFIIKEDDIRIEINYNDFNQTLISLWSETNKQENIEEIAKKINTNSKKINEWNYVFVFNNNESLKKTDEKIFKFFEDIIFPALNDFIK